MIREKIIELIALAIEIQERGKGDAGYPYIKIELSNYSTGIAITIKDDGFDSGSRPSGKYEFYFDEVSERTYQNCKQHLIELKEKSEQMIRTEDGE